jgi:hypothetical protein
MSLLDDQLKVVEQTIKEHKDRVKALSSAESVDEKLI